MNGMVVLQGDACFLTLFQQVGCHPLASPWSHLRKCAYSLNTSLLLEHPGHRHCPLTHSKSSWTEYGCLEKNVLSTPERANCLFICITISPSSMFCAAWLSTWPGSFASAFWLVSVKWGDIWAVTFRFCLTHSIHNPVVHSKLNIYIWGIQWMVNVLSMFAFVFVEHSSAPKFAQIKNCKLWKQFESVKYPVGKAGCLCVVLTVLAVGNEAAVCLCFRWCSETGNRNLKKKIIVLTCNPILYIHRF